MSLQTKLAIFIIIGLVALSVFAEERAQVLIPIDDLSYFQCEMQTKEELKYGFVDFTTCVYCKVIDSKVFCVDKAKEL